MQIQFIPCACGCGELIPPTDNRGRPHRYCPGHVWRTGTMTERFWKHVEKTDTCWLWTANRDRNGYGKLSFRERSRGSASAHRYSWQIHHGPIPDGMYVCHVCDNPPCVNPAHLFLATNLENMADMASKGHTAGERNSQARLTANDVITIRQRYATGGTSTPRLAREFHVHQAAIWLIVRRKTWRHIP